MKSWIAIIGFYAVIYSSLPVQAQSGVPDISTVKHPWFIGANTFEGSYEVFLPLTSNETAANLWQLTVGRNMSPRFALQFNYTYTHEVDNVDPSYTGTNLLGQYESGSSYDERWTHCMPALARYTLVGHQRPRLQVDAILGLTFLKTSGISARQDKVDNQVVFNYHQEFNAKRQFYATAGLGFRYPFGQHLEGVFDWTYSRNFHEAPEYIHLNTVGNSWGITKAVSLGLRYRFRLKKPPVPAVNK